MSGQRVRSGRRSPVAFIRRTPHGESTNEANAIVLYTIHHYCSPSHFARTLFTHHCMECERHLWLITAITNCNVTLTPMILTAHGPDGRNIMVHFRPDYSNKPGSSQLGSDSIMYLLFTQTTVPRTGHGFFISVDNVGHMACISIC